MRAVLMSGAVLLMSVLGGQALAAPPLPGRSAPAPVDPADPGALARALSARDGVPCSALGPADAALRDALLALTAASDAAPAVPVRAAACLIEQLPADPAVLSAAAGWLQSPATAGLGLVVLQDLSRFAPADRAALASVALQMPDPVWLRRYHTRLLQSDLPDVAAIAQAAPAMDVKKATE